MTNQNSLFRSRDWLSANQGPEFPDLGVCWFGELASAKMRGSDPTCARNYSLPLLTTQTLDTTYPFGEREGDIGLHGHGEDLLESVDERVRHASLCAVSDLERDGSDVGNGRLEFGDQLLIC